MDSGGERGVIPNSPTDLNSVLKENIFDSSDLEGPLAIFWDIENCPIPRGVDPTRIEGNIMTALREHAEIKGPVVKLFSAYGDFCGFREDLNEGLQRSGVKLSHVPNGRKEAADKAILVDMLLFAADNRPPSSIMLISGDIDFSQALHVLRQRGHTVFLVIRSGVIVSPTLRNAAKFVWDWHSLASGEGCVVPPSAGNGQNKDEEALLPSGLNKPDLNALKGQFVEMLKSLGKRIALNVVCETYCTFFLKDLVISDYGEKKLSNLLKKMSDRLLVEKENGCLYVSLIN